MCPPKRRARQPVRGRVQRHRVRLPAAAASHETPAEGPALCPGSSLGQARYRLTCPLPQHEHRRQQRAAVGLLAIGDGRQEIKGLARDGIVMLRVEGRQVGRQAGNVETAVGKGNSGAKPRLLGGCRWLPRRLS